MTNGTDDDIYHQFHHKADKEKKQRERESGADTSAKSKSRYPSSHDYHKNKAYVPPTYRNFTVAETKANFSKILREMERGDFDGALITSYGRRVGVMYADRVLHKK